MDNLAATGGVTGPGRIGRVAIGDLLKRAARRFPDRVALTDGGRQVTFTELERDANRFANHLVQRGLKPGEKISTICNNSVEFVKALFGIHRAGLVWVPINTMLGPADMDYILGHAEVRFAIIDDNLHAQADRRAALEARGMEMIAVDLAGNAGKTGLQEFNGLLEGQSDIEPEIEINDRDLAMIIYTSGTTSRPKGAMHCHLAVVMAVMRVLVPAMIVMMIVAMMVIMFVMALRMAGLGIGAAFRIERRLDLDDARAETLDHRLDHVVTADAQALGHDLGRQMPVAEMPG